MSKRGILIQKKQQKDEAEIIREKREQYRCADEDNQYSLSKWKSRESARSFFKLLSVLLFLATVVLGVYTGYLYTSSAEYTTWLYVSAACLGAFVIVLIIRAIVGHSCKKAFVRFYESEERFQDAADELKRAKLDPTLENTIAVCVRSFHKAPVVDDEDEEEDEDEKDEDERTVVIHKDPKRVITMGSVDSATVTIDNMEVGALDLGRAFTAFEVKPGLHALKLNIRKNFYGLNKTLELTTPVNPIRVDGNYRAVLYAVCSKEKKNGTIKYELKVIEYDDMLMFLRDLHNTDERELIERERLLGKKLMKRRLKLLEKLGVEEEDPENVSKMKEAVAYGMEKVIVDELGDSIVGGKYDARLQRDYDFHICVTNKSEN